MSKKFFAHSSAIVDKGSQIGQGTKIWHNAHVTDTARIGKSCSIGQNCYIAGIVGNNCKIQNNVNVYHGVELGNYAFCGPSMTFTNILNPRSKYPQKGKYIKTKVGEGVSFGAHCTIVCGIEIGEWAFIGAGSVVTKDIPAYAIVFGTPARIKGWMCECGEKLESEFKTCTCKKCKRKYKKSGTTVQKIS